MGVVQKRWKKIKLALEKTPVVPINYGGLNSGTQGITTSYG